MVCMISTNKHCGTCKFYEEHKPVLYLCDRMKCFEMYGGLCPADHDCTLTTDVTHAVSFEYDNGYYSEKTNKADGAFVEPPRENEEVTP